MNQTFDSLKNIKSAPQSVEIKLAWVDGGHMYDPDDFSFNSCLQTR